MHPFVTLAFGGIQTKETGTPCLEFLLSETVTNKEVYEQTGCGSNKDIKKMSVI